MSNTIYTLHASWVPLAEKLEAGTRRNDARLHLWVETAKRGKAKGSSHPAQLSGKALKDFFGEILGLGKAWQRFLNHEAPLFVTLPSLADGPLPSLELLNYLGEEPPEAFSWKSWQVASLVSNSPLALLKELHFAANSRRDAVILGSDFLFWHAYSRQLAQWIRQHRYVPALAVHPGKGRGRSKTLE